MWKDKGLQIEIGWALIPMKQSTVARGSVNDDLIYKESGLHRNILGQIHPLDVNLFSTDDIVPGDWFLPIDGCIEKAKDNYFKLPHDRKIIASNNPSLNLPQFPSSFLEEYVKRYNSKKSLEVEVEYYIHGWDYTKDIMNGGDYNTYIPIVNDNTISIRFKEDKKPCTHEVVSAAMKIVSKDVRTPEALERRERMYSRSEVESLVKESYFKGRNDELDEIETHRKKFPEQEINRWIKENLK